MGLPLWDPLDTNVIRRMVTLIVADYLNLITK